MTEEYGPWVTHDNTPCPVPLGYIIQGKSNRGCGCITNTGDVMIDTRAQNDPIWTLLPTTGTCLVCLSRTNITSFEYRIKKPRALVELLSFAKGIPENAETDGLNEKETHSV